MNAKTQQGGSASRQGYAGWIDRALAEHVRFAPDVGQIALFGQRMLPLHATSFAALRRELVERLGILQAREIMTRLGYQQGYDDGVRVLESAGDHPIDELLAMGPRLRAMEGFVVNQPIDNMTCDVERGTFWGDYLWTGSMEAEAHLEHLGLSGSPACWMIVGYASGYCTAITGMPILWREIECSAMGHSHCRVIGRPLAEWSDLSKDDTSYLHAEAFVGLPKSDAPVFGLTPPTLGNMVGVSAGFNAVAGLVRRVALTDSTVLFLGESGVGKERFAKALHSISVRADKPFVAINCAAIPDELVESELFGVEKGAFTGADRSRPGRFERADGGILFLDEIATLPLPSQGKLLRALQEREIERVGDSRVRKVDVRIIAAANRDLRQEVEAGRFREDLFYRLNVFPVTIPPLRDRRSDIPLLVSLFLQNCSSRFGKTVAGLTRHAHEALWNYDWPGNVRELENMIERAVILCDEGGSIDIQHLFAGGERINTKLFGIDASGRLEEAGRTAPGEAPADDPVDSLLDEMTSFKDLEDALLKRALHRCHGNASAAARMLKMGRGQFEYRLRKAMDRSAE